MWMYAFSAIIIAMSIIHINGYNIFSYYEMLFYHMQIIARKRAPRILNIYYSFLTYLR